MDQPHRQRTRSAHSQAQDHHAQEQEQRLVDQFLHFTDSPEPSNQSLSSAASAGLGPLGVGIDMGAMDNQSHPQYPNQQQQPFGNALGYQQQQNAQFPAPQHHQQHQQHSLTPAQMMWGNVAAAATANQQASSNASPHSGQVHINGTHLSHQQDELSAFLLSPTSVDATTKHHQQYPPATMPAQQPQPNGMSLSPIPSHSRQNSQPGSSVPPPASGNDMLAILAQSFSNTQATQELLLRKLEEQTQQNALLQSKLAEVERQQREIAAATAKSGVSTTLVNSGHQQQQAQQAHSVVQSAVASAIHSAAASPMTMGQNPPLPSGFGSHRSQRLSASRNVSLDANAPFVAPIQAPSNAFTPSEAFSRLSMQAHEPFSPLTSPVFQTYIVPSPTVTQAANSNALPPLPPAAQFDQSSALQQHQSQDVDMDWFHQHDSAALHPNNAQQLHQAFPAPTQQALDFQVQDQHSYLPVTPAALMCHGGSDQPVDASQPAPAMPSTLMQQWNTNSSSYASRHQPNDSPSPHMPPAALPPPASSLAKESCSSARSSSSPGPLIGSKPVAAEHTNNNPSSSTRRSVTKHASKLAAAPYVRQSPRMAPMSPAMVASLGGSSGPSPALGPRRNSPPNMVAAAVAAASASPAMVPVGAVPLTPANALGPSAFPLTQQQQQQQQQQQLSSSSIHHPPTPAMPPTPTSQTLHPVSSGQMHPYPRQVPPNLSLVSPAIHPVAAADSGAASGTTPAFPTPLPPPAIDIPHTYHPYHQQHPPHLINLSGLGGYSSLGLGGGMLLHDYLGFPGPGSAVNGPGGASGAGQPGAPGQGGGGQDDGDDMDDDNDDPEARKNSHRTAEQKRRNAMKDGFDELRRLVPGLQNSVTQRRSKYNPIDPQPPVSRKKRRDAKNEGKGISKIMVLKAAYDYCAFLASRERRLRELVVQLAQRQQQQAQAAGPAGEQQQVPVPADLLETADDIFFTYVKETLWKSAAAQQQAVDEILMAAGDEPASASSGVATAAGSSMGEVAATTSPTSVTEANGTVAKAVAAVAKATGSTPAVAKAVVQKVSHTKSNAAANPGSTDVVMAER